MYKSKYNFTPKSLNLPFGMTLQLNVMICISIRDFFLLSNVLFKIELYFDALYET